MAPSEAPSAAVPSPVAPPPAAAARATGRIPAVALRRAAPALLAAALALVYLLWSPPSIDLAATEYRTDLFGAEGLSLWDTHWYAGHHMPGYSVLLPPLGWLLGPRLLGALCVVAAALLFERLAHDRFGERAFAGSMWFALGTVTILLSGRFAFGLGLVPALGALLALERSAAAGREGRRRGLLALALLLALLSGAASPVAAILLAMAATADALAAPWRADPRTARSGVPGGRRADTGAARPRAAALLSRRRLAGLAVAAAAVLPVGVFAIAFPEGGTEPFVLSAFWPTVAVAVAALALIPREQRTLRIGFALYALGCTAAFVLDTPVGGNAARLGALCAGPIFALALWRRRPLALALLFLPLLYWQWASAIHDVRVTHGDPSVSAAYYAPLLGYLARVDPDGVAGRVEIPFTKLHWEARHVAPEHAIARGWERQLDHKVNPVFYDGQLTPDRYRAWLERNAVRWVALPDTRMDYSARAEARLVEDGLPYLREVWRGGAWRVFAVAGATPLVSGPARVTQLSADRVTLSVDRPGTLLLRMHWTPYWDVAAGAACVAPGPAQPGTDASERQTRVIVRRAGEVRLATRFALGRIASLSPRC